MNIKNVGIVGAGMMGSEIGLCFAMAGKTVILNDIKPELAENGKSKQETILRKNVEKGKLTEEQKNQILSRVQTSADLADLKDCDLIIEAAAEIVDVKQSIFRTLDRECKKETILASNTSSISITKLAECLTEERKLNFSGMHYFSPASKMKLVEVIPTKFTSNETVQKIRAAAQEIGKDPITVKDVPGFVVNRMLNIFFIEAIRLLEENVASKEDIDKACKLGLGHPVGPIELLDITGLDLNLYVHTILREAYGDRFEPQPLLKEMVEEGRLGKKVKHGFYDYE